jgi:hypothetical protein
MKRLKVTFAWFLTFTPPLLAGEFINLGFNEPDLNGKLVSLGVRGPYLGLTAQLLAGWKLTADGQIVTEATYSPINSGSGNGILELNEARPNYSWGNYLILASVDSNEGKPGPDLWLSQTGTVPKDAVGLWVFGDPPIEGFMDGVKIGFIDPNLGRTVWNVEAFQGKTVNLQIHSGSGHINRFDIMGFTTIPEPSEYAMFGLGLGLLSWQCWNRRGYLASGGSR